MDVQHQIKRVLSEPACVEKVRRWLAEGAEPHRTGLARRVCAEFGFRDPLGRPQISTCLKALRDLEGQGVLRLPPPMTRCGPARAAGLGRAVPAPVGVGGEVGQLRGLELVLVESIETRRIWTELMAREHPQGSGPLVGRSLRYLVGSQHGWLGGLGFAAAALKLADRDSWIGWDQSTRRAHLHRIVGLARFLIRPMVRCRNLASHVLSLAMRRLADDFSRLYGYAPWLVESFVEQARHDGACFRASNWVRVGSTRGRGRQDRHHQAEQGVKAIYLYELEPGWRAELGVGAAPDLRARVLEPAEGLDCEHWAEQEFGGAPLGDRRRARRLVLSVRLQADDPMRAFTGVASSDWPAVKAYYRLIDQPADSEVTPQNILAVHRQRTIERMRGQSTVLCIQDGTTLNFATRPQCTGLGIIAKNQTGATTLGLHQHSTLVVNPEGLPLGVLRAQWFEPTLQKKPATRLEEKKTWRWIEGLKDLAGVAAELPRTCVVCVMDREADVWDLFEHQRRQAARVHLLVRAKHDRALGGGQRLFDWIRRRPVQATLSIAITRQSARPKASKRPARAARRARIAEMAVRYDSVRLRPPSGQDAEALPVRIVHVKEQNPPRGAKPLEWLLLTTLPIESGEQAEKVVSWYALRWRIEDWHRVLKTGCRVEDLAHHTAERLKRAIAIRLVIAWRILLMTLLGRQLPNLPPEVLFSDLEIMVLSAWASSRRLPPPTNLAKAVELVARLGGYLARTRDPPPGPQLLWHGFIALTDMCIGYQLAQPHENR